MEEPMDVEQSLATRRSRRSTAGNRMEAALAEMNIDDLIHDAEEDIDFISKVEEEEDEIFESDFASTEEEPEEDGEVAEKKIEEEERRAKRAARIKATKYSSSQQFKVSFSQSSLDKEGRFVSKVKPKPQRRVSLGNAVDAETGEVLETAKRQSTREATRLNTQELYSRLKDAENKKVSVPKRPKEKKRRLAQTDLIEAARTLETVNIKSHNEYLASEEERRKKARATKPATDGPKLRWRSRIEDVTITVYEPVLPPSHPVYQGTWPNLYGVPNSPQPQPSGTPNPNPHLSYSGSMYPTTYMPTSQAPPNPSSALSGNSAPSTSDNLGDHSHSPQPSSTPSKSKAPKANTSVPSTSDNPSGTKTSQVASTSGHSQPTVSSKSATVSTPNTPGPSTPATAQTYPFYSYPYYSSAAHTQQLYPSYSNAYYGYPPSSNYYPSQTARPHLQLQPPQQVARKKVEKQAKNYVDVLLDENSDKKPPWRETMDSLFGSHADWDNVRVYVGKNRPITRQSQTCPITGLPGRYRDPRSGVPYANAGAYRILTRLLNHEYVWSPRSAGEGVFIGHEKQRGAIGAPERWSAVMGGNIEEDWQQNAAVEETEKKEERLKQRTKAKEKLKEREYRVGERRSSRIAAENSESINFESPIPNG